MALQLNQSFETPQGIVVGSTYWRWVAVAVDVPSSTCRGVLYAYASETAFTNGKQPIGQREYQITGESFATLATQLEAGTGGGISTIIYAYVRASDPFFAEAVAA